MFACLPFKTKLIFMPHGGRFLLKTPRALPFHPPTHLPGCVLLPPPLVGTSPKGFLTPQPLFSPDLICHHLCPLTPGILYLPSPRIHLAACELCFSVPCAIPVCGDFGSGLETAVTGCCYPKNAATPRMLQPQECRYPKDAAILRMLLSRGCCWPTNSPRLLWPGQLLYHYFIPRFLPRPRESTDSFFELETLQITPPSLSNSEHLRTPRCCEATAPSAAGTTVCPAAQLCPRLCSLSPSCWMELGVCDRPRGCGRGWGHREHGCLLFLISSG